MPRSRMRGLRRHWERTEIERQPGCTTVGGGYMARKLFIAVEQPIADCRWSRLSDQPTRITKHRDQHEIAWVCVRTPGKCRAVSEPECAECVYWEADDGALFP